MPKCDSRCAVLLPMAATLTQAECGRAGARRSEAFEERVDAVARRERDPRVDVQLADRAERVASVVGRTDLDRWSDDGKRAARRELRGEVFGLMRRARDENALFEQRAVAHERDAFRSLRAQGRWGPGAR